MPIYSKHSFKCLEMGTDVKETLYRLHCQLYRYIWPYKVHTVMTVTTLIYPFSAWFEMCACVCVNGSRCFFKATTSLHTPALCMWMFEHPSWCAGIAKGIHYFIISVGQVIRYAFFNCLQFLDSLNKLLLRIDPAYQFESLLLSICCHGNDVMWFQF